MDPRVKTLVKTLKNKSPEIRQNAAKELGKLQVEKAVRPLIKMADGGSRKFFARYYLNDQIAAIEALAETGSREALKFIERINVNRLEMQHTEIDKSPFPRQNGDYFISSEKIVYPLANGALKSTLEEDTSLGMKDTVIKLIENSLNRIKETVAEKEKNTGHKDIENKETGTQRLMMRINDACLSTKQAACCIGYLAWDLGCASLIPITTLGSAVLGTAIGAAPGMVVFNSFQVNLGNSAAAGAYILGSGIAMSVGACAGMFLGVYWGYRAGISIGGWLYEHNPFENALG